MTHPALTLLIDEAKKEGATSADALYVSSTHNDVRVLNHKMDAFETASSDAIGLRVFVGQRQSVVRTSNFDTNSLTHLAHEAVRMAKASPEDPYAGLAQEGFATPEDIDAFQKTCKLKDSHGLTHADALKERALAVEEAGRSNPKVTKSGGAWASASVNHSTLITSNGFEGSYHTTAYALGCQMLAGHGNHMAQEYVSRVRRHESNLPPAEEIGQLAGEKVVRRLGAASINLGKVPVVFSEEITGSLLSEFISAINGAAIARGTSFLKDALGTQVFANGITITDDPTRVHGLASRPFDAEGIRTQKRVIVEDGVLKSWLLDTMAARKLGLNSTGHASRSLGSLPSPSPSNMYIAPSNISAEDLRHDIKRGFFVTGLIGHGGNTITGDYSLGAEGYLIEDGAITSPIHEVTIAGNLANMFSTLTTANNPSFNSSIGGGDVRVEGMVVAGK